MDRHEELYRILGRIEAAQTDIREDIREINRKFEKHEERYDRLNTRIGSLERFKAQALVVLTLANSLVVAILEYFRRKIT